MSSLFNRKDAALSSPAENYVAIETLTSALEASERRYRALVENQVEGVILFDSNGIVQYINNSALKMLGFGSKVAAQLPLEQLLGAKGVSWVKEQLDQKGKKQTSTEIEITFQTGDTKYILVNAMVLPEDKDLEREYFITIWDVTANKRAEKVLQQREQSFRSLVENTPDCIERFDRKFQYLYVNPAFERQFDILAEQLHGKGMEATGSLSKAEMLKLTRAISMVFRTGVEQQVEVNRVPHLHNPKHFLIRIAPEYNTLSGNVSSVLCVSRDITERKQAEVQLEYASNHDGLTGLYNRAYYEMAIQKIRADGSLYPVSAIVVDADGLKLLNDTYGHKLGDELIIEIAKILKACFRSDDLVARTGGDEFIIILPQTDESLAAFLHQRIIEKVQEHNKALKKFQVSVSIGVATTHVPADLDTAIQQADERMYADKAARKAGRQ